MRHNWIIPPLNISPECECCEHPFPIATHCEVRVRLGVSADDYNVNDFNRWDIVAGKMRETVEIHIY